MGGSLPPPGHGERPIFMYSTKPMDILTCGLEENCKVDVNFTGNTLNVTSVQKIFISTVTKKSQNLRRHRNFKSALFAARMLKKKKPGKGREAPNVI